MGYAILGVILLVAILVIASIKLKEFRHRYLWIFIAFTVAFFAFTFIYVFLKSGIDMTSYEGFLKVGKLYVGWLATAVRNLGSLTGYVAKQDWGINLTNATIG